jgi:hypothetical protein
MAVPASEPTHPTKGTNPSGDNAPAGAGPPTGLPGRTIETAKKSSLSSIAEKTQSSTHQREDDDETTQSENGEDNPSDILEMLRAGPTKSMYEITFQPYNRMQTRPDRSKPIPPQT